MERPSVCSNADGVLDIAVDNETSFLFKVKDGNDLTDKLEQLILNNGRRKLFGVNARKQVMKKFDLEIITDNTISTYSTLIKDKR